MWGRGRGPRGSRGLGWGRAGHVAGAGARPGFERGVAWGRGKGGAGRCWRAVGKVQGLGRGDRRSVGPAHRPGAGFGGAESAGGAGSGVSTEATAGCRSWVLRTGSATRRRGGVLVGASRGVGTVVLVRSSSRRAPCAPPYPPSSLSSPSPDSPHLRCPPQSYGRCLASAWLECLPSRGSHSTQLWPRASHGTLSCFLE